MRGRERLPEGEAVRAVVLTVLLCGCAHPDYGPAPARMFKMERVRFDQQKTMREADYRRALDRGVAEWEQRRFREAALWQHSQSKTNQTHYHK